MHSSSSSSSGSRCGHFSQREQHWSRCESIRRSSTRQRSLFMHLFMYCCRHCCHYRYHCGGEAGLSLSSSAGYHMSATQISYYSGMPIMMTKRRDYRYIFQFCFQTKQKEKKKKTIRRKAKKQNKNSPPQPPQLSPPQPEQPLAPSAGRPRRAVPQWARR
ncbi:hypothetical protein T492DRAFT_309795 [Pavlovales sp. CCMP2436]|nr:hypothetical protein T492DRAFT_309795 [Pavlovales sp. CCMP2436]